MLKTNNNYEIWDIREDEPLVDGLTFGDAAEMSQTYMDFYGAENIVICYKKAKAINLISQQEYAEKRLNARKQEFVVDWINYFEELSLMGNLEYS